MKNKYLVIGSNSFCGSNFINYILSKKKNIKVIGVSRSNEIKKYYLTYKQNKNIDNFKFKKIDLNRDVNKLIQIILKFRPKYIVNFAAQGMVAESWKYPIDWYNTNLISQIKLHEKIRKFKFIKKFLQFSTPEVYGSHSALVKENFNFNPSTPYASSRAACDLHLNNFYQAYKFPVLFTRTANVYGPGQQLYRILPKCILFAKKNKKLMLHGKGKSKRSFIYIDDVSEALDLLLDKGKIGKTYHISTNNFLSIYELVILVNKILKTKKINLKFVKDRLGKDHSYKLSSSLIRTQFYWKPKINLKKGIIKTIDWIEDNYKYLNKKKTDYLHKK